MEISWVKPWLQQIRKNKLYKKYEAKTYRLIEKGKQNSDLADIITTASFLLILFVAYLILNRTALLAGLFLLGATFLRFVDDSIILNTNIATKLRKFYNILLNFSAEAIILFATVFYFYTLNLYVAVIFTLLLLILSMASHYLVLLAQAFYKIKRIDEFFKRLYLFAIFSFGLIIDQLMLAVIICIFGEIVSIQKIIQRIFLLLNEHDQISKKNKKNKIAKKK